MKRTVRQRRTKAKALNQTSAEDAPLEGIDTRVALVLSLKTTNVLESIHARVASRTDKVNVWKNSDQKHRWLATALLDLEPRLHRIRGFAALPRLQQALLRHVRRDMPAA